MGVDSNIKTWINVVKTNFIANYLIIRILFKLIGNSRSGRIICVTSTAAWKVRSSWSSYSSSKAGLEMFIKIFDKENKSLIHLQILE